jgi:SAM-dependent methyltransferase
MKPTVRLLNYCIYKRKIRLAEKENGMDLHDYQDVAESYDEYILSLTSIDHQEDVVEFHSDLAKKYGHQGIIDLGCGTGATLIPLIQAGYRVTGIDISQAMLDVLQGKLDGLPDDVRRNAATLCASMSDFDLDEKHSLAIIPQSGFLHLLTEQDQEQALRCIHRHLTPDGVLSFNTFDPNYARIAENVKGSNPQPELRAEYRNARGNHEQVWNVIEYDPTQQLMEGFWIFKELDDSGKVMEERKRPVRMRWSFAPEIEHLLRLCGFEVVEMYSSYTKEPREYGGWIIWVAKRSSG